MGRSKKPEPRDRQLNLSLTISEFESIKRRAEVIGMRPVHFGRALLLDQRCNVSLKHEAHGTVNRLVYMQLARLGNNLNQMMRHLHRTGDPLPSDLEPLLKDIRDIISRELQR